MTPSERCKVFACPRQTMRPGRAIFRNARFKPTRERRYAANVAWKLSSASLEPVPIVRIHFPPPSSPYLWRYLSRITEKPAPAASFCEYVVAEKTTFRQWWTIRGENLYWQIQSDRLGRRRNRIEADEETRKVPEEQVATRSFAVPCDSHFDRMPRRFRSSIRSRTEGPNRVPGTAGNSLARSRPRFYSRRGGDRSRRSRSAPDHPSTSISAWKRRSCRESVHPSPRVQTERRTAKR
jgi:hypothetical protein